MRRFQTTAPLARADLTANHESQPARKLEAVKARRTQKEQLEVLATLAPYGIYRPLTAHSRQELMLAAIDATQRSSVWLHSARKSGDMAKIALNSDFGVTFLGYQGMRTALIGAVKEAKLQPEALIEDLNAIDSPEIEVPISHFEWDGNERRRLLARYALDHMARRELDMQRRMIDEALSKHGVKRRPVEPDHTSIVRYGQAGDKQDLSARHRREIANIYEETFIERGVGCLALGSIVVGTSYSKQLKSQDFGVKVYFSNELAG